MTITRVAASRKQKEYLYLRPTKCFKQPKCSAISYQEVLEQTIERICQDLPRAVAAMNVPNMDGIKGTITHEIAAKQDILAQLPTLTDNGILDSETAQLRAYKLRTEISQLQSRMVSLPPVNLQAIAQAVSISQFWLDLSESERRFYFREFIRQIEINRQDSSWEIELVFIF